MHLIGITLLGTALAQGPEESVPSELLAAQQAGAAAAREQVRPGLALASGIGGAGVPAALGLGLGAVPTLGLPVIGALGCGALGCASVAWAWDIADTAPLPGEWQNESELYQDTYREAFDEALLRQRRRWVYLGGAAITVALAGGYAGVTALVGTAR